jgi:glycosyltransferase involved in cell wall biosynthesis
MKRVLILAEGSYPQKLGGVSIWTHNLVSRLENFKFDCISLTSKEKKIKYKSKNLEKVYWVDISKPKKNIRYVDHEITEKITIKLLNGYVLNEKDLINFNKFCIFSPKYFDVLVNLYKSKNIDVDFDHFFWAITNYFVIISQIAFNLNKINILKPKYDLIFALNVGFCGLLGCILKLKYDFPLVISEHGIILKEIKNLLKESEIKKEVHPYIINIYRSMMLTTYKFCDLIVSISDFHKENSVKNGCDPNKIKVVYTGIDVEKFKPPENKDYSKIIIGNVSRIDPIKGTKEFVEIANYVTKKLKNVEFWHIGPIDDKEYSKKVFELNKKYGFPVIFKGKTDNPEEYYKKIHIYLNTSLSEGLPLAILEAQASGVPAICSNVGACKYVCYKYYNKFEDKEKGLEEVYKHISELCDVEKLKKVSNEVRKIVEKNFNINKMVKEYEHIFNSIIKKCNK